MFQSARFFEATAPLAPWRAVLHWRARERARALRHRLLQTPLGRYTLVLTVIAALVAAPAIGQLLRRGAWSGPAPLQAEAKGALVIGHIALILGFTAFFVAILARTFVLRRDDGVFQAHPSALPIVALSRLAVAWTTAATGVLPLFYLFHWHFLARLGAPWWAALPLHLVTTLAWLLVAALPIVAWLRVGLRSKRIERRARLLHVLGFIIAWLSLSAPVLLVPYLRADLPRIAAAADRLLYLGLCPLAAVTALSGGDVWRLAAWGAVLGAGVVIAFRTAVGWAVRAPWELPLDLGDAGPVRYASAFRGRGGDGGIVGLFWTKDLRLPATRQPLSFLLLHWGLFTSGIGWVALVRAACPPALQLPAVTSAVIAIPAIIALLRTPGSLGSEGDSIWLLRAVLTPAELFACKLLPGLARVALPGAMHGAILGAAARAIGVAGPPLIAAVALGAGAGLLFALGGTVAGFLFPDFSRSHVLVPGASRLALLSYLVPTLLTLAWAISVLLIHSLTALPTGALVLLLGGFPAAVAGGWGAMAAWALRRMKGWER